MNDEMEKCCKKNCKTKSEMRATHGTPREFAEAANRAADQVMCTTAECNAAIKRYESLYEEAPL